MFVVFYANGIPYYRTSDEAEADYLAFCVGDLWFCIVPDIGISCAHANSRKEAQADGYKNGFAVDIVTRSICG